MHRVCRLINIFRRFPFSRKCDRKKEKSVVSLTYEKNIICSQTKLGDMARKQTIICRQLFASHVAGSRPMKRKNNLHRAMRLSMIWKNSGDRGECYLPRPISPRRDLHNSSYHMKTESNNANFFQIWSTLWDLRQSETKKLFSINNNILQSVTCFDQCVFRSMRVEKNVYEYLRPCLHCIGQLLHRHENHTALTGWPPSTHRSGDVGSISETERSCAVPAILKVDLHRSDRFLQLFAAVNVQERGLAPITYIHTHTSTCHRPLESTGLPRGRSRV